MLMQSSCDALCQIMRTGELDLLPAGYKII